tara:strand:+ start:350 stop:694 length:345 start_codon:yes stop_codon:yes gene_type:complete
MNRQLYSQVDIFGGVESPHSANDFLLFAEEKVIEYEREGRVVIGSDIERNRAVIATAVTYTARFDEECIKRGFDEGQKDRARLFMMEVLGHEDQISQETLSRSWRKLRNGRGAL